MPWPDFLRNLIRAPQPALSPAASRPTPPVSIARPRGRPSWALGGLDAFRSPYNRVPVSQNYGLYHTLRETCPTINAAIKKTSEFIGTPTLEAESETKKDIEAWLESLKVNRLQSGWKNWLGTWTGNQSEYGRAHTEIILTADRKDVYALSELHPATIYLRPATDRYSVDVVQNQPLNPSPVKLNPLLLLNAVHNVMGDDPNGTSLLWGMPFVAEILTKITHALGNTWDRFGVPTYHVNWDTPEGFSDPMGSRAREIMGEMRNDFSQALASQKEQDVRDFYTSGKVTVTVIGAAGEQLDFETPKRALTEEIVAATGIPPFLFGFHWSTTERMSAVQATVLTEMITDRRDEITGEIKYLIGLRQQLTGGDAEFDLCWPAPTLIDELDTSRAALFTEQSQAQRLENAEAMWRIGVFNRFDFARAVRPDLEKLDDADIARRLPKLPAEPPALPEPATGGASGQPARNGTNPQMNLNMAEIMGLKNGAR